MQLRGISLLPSDEQRLGDLDGRRDALQREMAPSFLKTYVVSLLDDPHDAWIHQRLAWFCGPGKAGRKVDGAAVVLPSWKITGPTATPAWRVEVRHRWCDDLSQRVNPTGTSPKARST